MASVNPQATASSGGASQVGDGRAAANEPMVLVAQRELLSALVAQVRPPLDMYALPSRAETAAFDRAVHVICREAHKLDLRAEELLIAIKYAWSQLAPARKNHLGERDGDVLREIVSSSIEEFFEARARSDA